MFYFLRKFDWIQLLAIVVIMAISLTVLYSISSGPTTRYPDVFIKQLLFCIIGIIFYFIFAIFSYSSLKGVGVFFYAISVFLLISVLFLGIQINGSRSWFDLGFTTIQPSEFVKLCFIIFLAEYLDKNQTTLRQFRHFFFILLFSAFLCGLVIIQPDFGTAIVLCVIVFVMMPLSGVRFKYCATLIGGFVIFLPMLSFFIPHIKARFEAFLNPASVSGYNVRQALIAFGSGGFWGKGIGKGDFSRANFVPEHHTDFIFSKIGEEMGFLGVSILIGLFFILLLRVFILTKLARDNFGALIALGVFGMIFFQVFLNIGMNIGLLPVTGIPLPLVSYGGSSLLTSLISLGLVQSITLRRRDNNFEEEYN